MGTYFSSKWIDQDSSHTLVYDYSITLSFIIISLIHGMGWTLEPARSLDLKFVLQFCVSEWFRFRQDRCVLPSPLAGWVCLNFGSVSGVFFTKPVCKLNCRLSREVTQLRAQKGYEYFRYANRKEFSRCGPKKLWDSTEIDFSSLSSSILASGSPWNFEWFVKLRNFYFSECNLRAYHSFFGPQQCYPKLSVLESDRYLPSARSWMPYSESRGIVSNSWSAASWDDPVRESTPLEWLKFQNHACRPISANRNINFRK